MTALSPGNAPGTVADLLAELDALGVQLKADANGLRFRPRDKVGPELLDRLRVHKADLLATLGRPPLTPEPASAPASAPGCPESRAEPEDPPHVRRALERAGPDLMATVAELRRVFAPLGGLTIESIAPDPSWSRQRAAQAILRARRCGRPESALDLRDRWRERVAICLADGGLSEREAERIAADEVEGLDKCQYS